MTRFLGLPGDVSADEIVRRYDFIGTTESFVKNVLLLKEKLPISVSLKDVLYLKCQDSSTATKFWDNGRQDVKTWVRHKPYAQQSQRVRDFFDSKDFTDYNLMDSALWHAADKRLDQQAAAFGHERLNQTSEEFQKMLVEVGRKCQLLSETRCEGSHLRKCIDRVAAEMS